MFWTYQTVVLVLQFFSRHIDILDIFLEIAALKMKDLDDLTFNTCLDISGISWGSPTIKIQRSTWDSPQALPVDCCSNAIFDKIFTYVKGR